MLNILSFNAAGLADKVKRKTLFFYLRQLNPDIVFLQETHATLETESLWNLEWGSPILFSHGTSRAKGVAILFSNNLNYCMEHVEFVDNGRFIVAHINCNSKSLCLANIYAPNNNSGPFFENILGQPP